MNKGTLAALLLTGAAAVTGIVMQPSTKATSEVAEAVEAVEAVKEKPTEYAATMVSAIDEADRADKCPGGYVDTGADALCFAGKDAASMGEAITTAPAKRERLYACPAEGEASAYLAYFDPKTICAGGILIGTPLVKVACGQETDLVEALREACKPCPVGPMAWGKCPECLHAKGGCSSICKDESTDVTTTEMEARR